MKLAQRLRAAQSGALWTPAKISTALWLDASDSSTITLNGSTVSQWSDKSGNARHAIQGTTAAQPAYDSSALNGLGGVIADGASDYMDLASAITMSLGTAHSIFVVLKPTAAVTAASAFQMLLGRANITRPEVLLSLGSLTGEVANERLTWCAIDTAAAGAVFGRSQNTEDIPAAAKRIALVYAGGAAAQECYYDGVSKTFTAHSYGQFSTTHSPVSYGRIFARGNGTAFCAVTLCELIMVLGIVSSQTIQNIDEYFSTKWGF